MHSDAWMKPAPSSPLEVPKTELLLEILVVALNAPAHFCYVNQTFHRCVIQHEEPWFA
jgi:hypothetical protein